MRTLLSLTSATISLFIVASEQALIAGLLEKDPTQRLGVLAGKERDILKHEWFDDLELSKLRSKQIPAPWIPPTPSS
jgi:hypothetical protein